MAPGLTLTRRLRGRRAALALVLFAAVVINLPLAHLTWYEWRLDRDGVRTEATVTDTQRVPADGGRYVVEFRFDRELDPGQDAWLARVDRAAYETAEETGRIGVRMLPDRPATYEVDGQQQSSLPLVITLVGDVMLLGMALLYWRTRPTGGVVHLRAVGDVERCKPTRSIEQLDEESYVVCGDVVGIEDDAIVLDIGHHTVRVDLAGHANPVGYQQPARVECKTRSS